MRVVGQQRENVVLLSCCPSIGGYCRNHGDRGNAGQAPTSPAATRGARVDVASTGVIETARSPIRTLDLVLVSVPSPSPRNLSVVYSQDESNYVINTESASDNWTTN